MPAQSFFLGAFGEVVDDAKGARARDCQGGRGLGAASISRHRGAGRQAHRKCRPFIEGYRFAAMVLSFPTRAPPLGHPALVVCEFAAHETRDATGNQRTGEGSISFWHCYWSSAVSASSVLATSSSSSSASSSVSGSERSGGSNTVRPGATRSALARAP